MFGDEDTTEDASLSVFRLLKKPQSTGGRNNPIR